MSRRLAAVVVALLASCSSPRGDLDGSELGFLQDMYDHHEQAVRMALLVVGSDDASPVTRAFATDIVASQRYEMGMIEGYLTAAGEERGVPGRRVMAWMDDPMPVEAMPGMASTDELAALDAATGGGIDELFFTLMIEHHEGGIAMAEHAIDHADADHVVALAERIRGNQRLEIADMGKAEVELGLR